MTIEHPYLLFLGDASDQLAAKTANGVAIWRREWCLGQLRFDGCKADTGVPDMTLDQAVAAGARTLVIGVANRGGRIAPSWQDTMLHALDLGMDIASGLHNKVADLAAVRDAADRLGRRLFDVRHPTEAFELGTGEPRSGPAPADRRHRCLGGQDVHDASDRTGAACARCRRRLPRHRPDRDLHCR